MRLLNVDTFALEDFFGAGAVPRYAILSHTWDGGEVSHQDIADLERAKQKAGFAKIRHICEQAREDGLDYAWVDTCKLDVISFVSRCVLMSVEFRLHRQNQQP
jgi:hypothetical protein